MKLGFNSTTSEMVAIKVVDKSRIISGSRDERNLEREVSGVHSLCTGAA